MLVFFYLGTLEVPQIVQVQSKKPKKSTDKLDPSYSKCPDQSKSRNCRKSGDIYSCNTQNLQKTQAARPQSYSKFHLCL